MQPVGPTGFSLVPRSTTAAVSTDVEVTFPGTVDSGGQLNIVTPETEFESGFRVESSEKLSVYSEELPDP
jgi:hypothetical protein